MKINHTNLKIIQGDITECQVDAIVNPAGGRLTMNAGLAAVIKKKGGESIEKEAVGKGPIKPGQAVWTQGGRLPAGFVIHAVTITDDGRTDEHIVRQACSQALAAAAQMKIRSVALPALGCGVGGFPVVGAAKIMAQEILRFARLEAGSVRDIVLCLYDDPTYQIFEKHVLGYIRHVIEDLGKGPFVTVDCIIELPEGVVLIERSNPPYGWALPGGFVDYGESLEEAVAREAKEETSLELEGLRQFHAYSEPGRDPRFHVVSTVFVAKGKGRPQFGDDAKGLKVVPYADLLKLEYAFDHRQIMAEYLADKRR